MKSLPVKLHTDQIMSSLPDILRTIIRRKAEEVVERAQSLPLREVARRVEDAPPPRPFAEAIEKTLTEGRPAVIAELKRASPSKGVLREVFTPATIAAGYEKAGATALSVLTDRDFFQGSDDHLVQARGASSLPVLRKDFIIDAYQVYEARALGADCVLLIVAALGDAALGELTGLAGHLDMDVLVEIHNAEELDRALALNTPLIGINNRNLHTFRTDLETTLTLLEERPEGRTIVTESGIHTRRDVGRLRDGGVHAFLVGEAFMTAPDPGARLTELFFGPSGSSI
uniref:Indole-3-glycerol phosphate synthase n=1 Tax=Candidatus Kentrum eta TaxID=2126337 RepID=A0A450VIK6_9GAMM|nr:MAG: indole-3-glycerol phosphate synthase [Candidatus Kentron sp. H]VFK04585.1 MAG: indole-3-glycerol phosphate synthase [Candidatus Kentron sp. H]VFK07638.1 MAG: indole-3-glycerol phosphate synthase [Candidatus Kentron sp. H]